jgi:hypothetical protein
MKARQLKSFILTTIVLTFAVLLFISFTQEGSKNLDKNISTLEVHAAGSPVERNVESIAPNGKMTIKLLAENSGTLTQWSISVMGTEIYSKEFPEEYSVVLPYNVFSPDNKYLLIKEILGDMVTYKVIKSDGGTFRDGANELDIGGLFTEKYKDLVITEATGWADVNLVLINTDHQNGDKGPSLWFNVLNKSFSRLSTRFD